MEEVTCGSCEKKWRAGDTAPYMRDADGTLVEACRKCISQWLEYGILWPIPFWKRKEEANVGR